MNAMVKIMDKINNKEYKKSGTIREKLDYITNIVRVMKKVKEIK
ncbi:28032_t:CDS:1, partial [Gigaspora margarita]